MRLRINERLFDMDGCLLHKKQINSNEDLKNDHKKEEKIKENFITTNAHLFKAIAKNIVDEKFAEVHESLFSSRGSYKADYISSIERFPNTNRISSVAAMRDLHDHMDQLLKEQNYVGHHIRDPHLMADSHYCLKSGTSDAAIFTEIAGKHFHPITSQYQYAHAQWIMDYSKLTLLYVKAHQAACEAKISAEERGLTLNDVDLVLDIYDDDIDIINGLTQAIYYELMPKATFRFYQYTGEKSQANSVPYKIIQGRGEIDVNFNDNAKVMAKCCRTLSGKQEISNDNLYEKDIEINATGIEVKALGINQLTPEEYKECKLNIEKFKKNRNLVPLTDMQRKQKDLEWTRCRLNTKREEVFQIGNSDSFVNAVDLIILSIEAEEKYSDDLLTLADLTARIIETPSAEKSIKEYQLFVATLQERSRCEISAKRFLAEAQNRYNKIIKTYNNYIETYERIAKLPEEKSETITNLLTKAKDITSGPCSALYHQVINGDVNIEQQQEKLQALTYLFALIYEITNNIINENQKNLHEEIRRFDNLIRKMQEKELFSKHLLKLAGEFQAKASQFKVKEQKTAIESSVSDSMRSTILDDSQRSSLTDFSGIGQHLPLRAQVKPKKISAWWLFLGVVLVAAFIIGLIFSCGALSVAVPVFFGVAASGVTVSMSTGAGLAIFSAVGSAFGITGAAAITLGTALGISSATATLLSGFAILSAFALGFSEALCYFRKSIMAGAKKLRSYFCCCKLPKAKVEKPLVQGNIGGGTNTQLMRRSISGSSLLSKEGLEQQQEEKYGRGGPLFQAVPAEREDSSITQSNSKSRLSFIE